MTMTKSDDEREFDRLYPMDSSILLITLPGDEGLPVKKDTQLGVLDEIFTPFNEYLRDALKRRDMDLALRLVMRADKILDTYIVEDFDLLVPARVQLRQTIFTIYRMLRRHFIRKVLTCDEADVPELLSVLEK